MSDAVGYIYENVLVEAPSGGGEISVVGGALSALGGELRVFSSGGSAVLPVTEGLVHRLDATVIDGLGHGDPVDIWQDLSVSNVDFIAAGGAPTYVAESEGGPFVKIGSAGRFTSTGVAAGSAGWTEFLVVRITGWSGNNPGFWRSGSSATGNTFHIFNERTGRPWVRWAGTDILKHTGPSITSQLLQLLTLRVTPGASGTGNVTYKIDGQSAYSIDRTIPATSFTAYHFPWQNDPTERVIGDYAERVAYDRPLSDSEVSQVESYLLSKWSSGPTPLPLEWDPGDGTAGPLAEETGGSWTAPYDTGEGYSVLRASSSGHEYKHTRGRYGINGEALWGSVQVRTTANDTLLAGLKFSSLHPLIDRRNGSGANDRALQIRLSGSSNLGTGSSDPVIQTGVWYTMIAKWTVGTELEVWLYSDSGELLGTAYAETTHAPNGGVVGVANYGVGNQFRNFQISTQEILP